MTLKGGGAEAEDQTTLKAASEVIAIELPQEVIAIELS